jgi:hypothetical protein
MKIYLLILKTYAFGTDKSQAYQKKLQYIFVLFFSEAFSGRVDIAVISWLSVELPSVTIESSVIV